MSLVILTLFQFRALLLCRAYETLAQRLCDSLGCQDCYANTRALTYLLTLLHASVDQWRRLSCSSQVEALWHRCWTPRWSLSTCGMYTRMTHARRAVACKVPHVPATISLCFHCSYMYLSLYCSLTSADTRPLWGRVSPTLYVCLFIRSSSFVSCHSPSPTRVSQSVSK